MIIGKGSVTFAEGGISVDTVYIARETGLSEDEVVEICSENKDYILDNMTDFAENLIQSEAEELAADKGVTGGV